MSLTLDRPAARIFHPLRITEVRQETADAISLAFAIPPDLVDTFRFRPGQYLTLRATVGEQAVRRAYSICSAPGAPLRIAIKRAEGGQFSPWAHDTLAEGHVLDVMPPEGRFVLPAAPTGPRHILAVAAGSGITPLLSILADTLVHEPGATVTLLYGSRTTASILFRDELEALKDRFMARFALLHVLSREQQDIPILNGRLDGARIRALAPSRPDLVLACGPTDLIEAVTAHALARGLPPASILSERFTPAGTPSRPSPAPEPGPAAAITATIIADGVATPVPVRADEDILTAALRAGLDLPYACRAGMCSTCRARVTAGTVAMAVNFGLEPWETEAGFALTCQAHPTTPHVTVDYDHV